MQNCKLRADDISRQHIVDVHAKFAARQAGRNVNDNFHRSEDDVPWDALAGHRLILADFAKNGDVNGAQQWFSKITPAPDDLCYAHLVHACFKARDDNAAHS